MNIKKASIILLTVLLLAIGGLFHSIRSSAVKPCWTGERPEAGRVVQVYGAWTMETEHRTEHTVIWRYAAGEEEEKKVLRILQQYGDEGLFGDPKELISTPVIVLSSGGPSKIFLKKM